MKRHFATAIFSLACMLLLSSATCGQPQNGSWSLKDCISYAIANNIQVKKMQMEVKNSEVNYDESKASLLPSLSAGINQSFTNESSISSNSRSSSLSGSYSVKSGVMLYNGYKLKNTIQQQDMALKSSQLSVKEAENSIELAATAAYLQVLYAREAAAIAENTLKSSESQLERAKTLLESGYISQSNLAQVQSQYGNDRYSLVSAQNNLNAEVLALKQLLELDINTSPDISFPEIDDQQVLKPIPAKDDVYNRALQFLPEVANSQLNIDIAQKNVEIAKAGLLPSLMLSASAGTGNNTAVAGGFATQIGNNFYQNAGLSLSIPIFSNKQVKSSIARAQIATETAKLNLADTKKNVLKSVENAYLDAVSAQSRFEAALEQKAYAETSYSLVEDQFNLGMKNTVDLLTAKTTLLEARQQYLQAKYSAILNYKLLDFYQQKPIEL